MQSQVLSACLSYRPIVPSIFLVKNTIFGLFNSKEVWSYRYAYGIPLVTWILNMCGFECQTTFFLAEVPFLAFSNIERGVAIWVCS